MWQVGYYTCITEIKNVVGLNKLLWCHNSKVLTPKMNCSKMGA